MPTLVKIGYTYFLVPKPANAARVCSALAAAVPMQRDYSSEGTKFYPEDEEHAIEVAVMNVRPEQILRQKPEKARVITTKQLTQ